MQALLPLRQRFRHDKAALVAAHTQGRSLRGARQLLQRLTALTDQLLQQLWQHAHLPEDYTLVAVGGYGRAQLFPHSDVDVLVLLPEAASAAQHEAIGSFISSCWDAGLELGSSVRTVAECMKEACADITVQTALLEARRVLGSSALFAQLRAAYLQHLDVAAFLTAKTLEMRQRHMRYENTPYALEPNCKESPGGLRDLHTVLWVARAAGLGQSWRELAANGLATPFELRQIERNEAFLMRIRAQLHVLARRHEDRLVFDLQNAVAASLGLNASTRADGQRPALRPSEALMRRYYWAAKAVTQLSTILLQGIGERLNPSTQTQRALGAHFFEKGDFIEVASDDLYQRQPQAILQTFLLYASTAGLQDLSARTLRALFNARQVMDANFRRDPVNRATFLRILQQPQGVTHTLRLMNQTSVLGRTLWPFRRIVGQMQHDLFHVYTVDQHILMVVRNMRRFFMPEHAHEYPYCSQLASGWGQPWLLYLAALFHDIGKGRGGDHSEIGAQEVRRFCHQHAIAGDDAALVEFLVREHLTMSQVAQKQDLSDPDVIAAFAQRVGSERRLTGLYLLTVADIRGTSPKVWSAWKGKLLEDLYRASLRVLGGGAAHPVAEVEARKREARILLALSTLPHEAHQRLWETLDLSYFMRHEAPDIAWHTRHLARFVGTQRPIVRARLSLAGEGLEVLLYTPDRFDLFVRLCGYFDRAGFSILEARIHTTKNGYALDTFQVVAQHLADHYRALISMVENDLPLALTSNDLLPEPRQRLPSRRGQSFPVPPRVTLHPDEKGQLWVLNIAATDRPGLLYLVARVLARHELNVQLAKISTLGERVEDRFLLQGLELQSSAQHIQIETELLQALGMQA